MHLADNMTEYWALEAEYGECLDNRVGYSLTLTS